MDLSEKVLYHQIHPVKLAADITGRMASPQIRTRITLLDHHANARFMQFKVFTKRECFSHEIRAPLTQRIIQSLDMIGFTRLFWYRTVSFGRKDTWIGTPFI